MKPKTIGIDARFYGEAGPGRYVKNVVQHLEKIDNDNKYVVFLRSKGMELYKPANKNFKKELADYKWYSFDEQIRFLFKLLKFNLDVLYVPHFNIPMLYPKRLVTAIPDLIMHTFSTEKGTTLPKVYFKFKKAIYKLVFWWAVVRSKKIIVPSNTVKQQFMDEFPNVSKEKYVIATEGVDPAFYSSDLDSQSVLKKYNITKPFLLYISSMYEHKNVAMLIEAFQILVRKYKFKGKLVLIGKKDKFSQRIYKFVKEQDLGDRVLMPGMNSYVTDEEIVSLRKEASAYVFPSLMEGFSLTPLEAQYVGLPCAISDIPCHKEIYEDSVLYFDPNDSKNMAQVIQRAIVDEDTRQSLIKKGYELVKEYSWENTAKVTLNTLKDL